MKMKKLICLTTVMGMMTSTSVFASQSTEVPENQEINVIQEEKDGEVLAGLVSTGERSIFYQVTGDGVRVRSKPSTSASVVGLLYRGDRVQYNPEYSTVTADGYVWVPIFNGSVTGWVADSYIQEY